MLVWVFCIWTGWFKLPGLPQAQFLFRWVKFDQGDFRNLALHTYDSKWWWERKQPITDDFCNHQYTDELRTILMTSKKDWIWKDANLPVQCLVVNIVIGPLFENIWDFAGWSRRREGSQFSLSRGYFSFIRPCHGSRYVDGDWCERSKPPLDHLIAYYPRGIHVWGSGLPFFGGSSIRRERSWLLAANYINKLLTYYIIAHLAKIKKWRNRGWI